MSIAGYSIISPTAAPSSAGIPPPAVAAGYLTQTYGQTLKFGGTGANLFKWNFFGYNNSVTPPSQQSDGTILLPGNDTANAGAATAHISSSFPNSWQGYAFGGGAYFDWRARWTPYAGALNGKLPALWLMNIEHLTGSSTWWPDAAYTAQGYEHWWEWDIMEFNKGTANTYGEAWHDWYRNHNVTPNVTSKTDSAYSATAIAGINFNNYNLFGALWIPATPSTLGRMESYVNNVLVNRTTYQLFDNNGGVVPPVRGTTGMSGMDISHMVPIIGNGDNASHIPDMQVSAIRVFQASTDDNLVQ